MTDHEMTELTASAETVSDKIRLLDRAGVEKPEIAKFLQITYQHVYNVLQRDRAKQRLTGKKAEMPSPGIVHEIAVGAGGAVTLPAAFIEAWGLADGDVLLCSQNEEGLKIMPVAAVAQLLVRSAKQSMPGQAELLDKLIHLKSQAR